MTNNSKLKRIDSYNALRGICAVGILFSHMSYLANASNPFWKAFYDGFMKYGSRCTTFFFIMSGFLVAYTWKEVSFKKYIKNKVKRLYPLTFFVFVLAVGCSFILNDTVNEGLSIGSLAWWLSIVLNIVLLKAFIPIENIFYSFHGPSWYISVLFVFYIVGYFIVKEMKNGTTPNKTIRAVARCITLVYAIEFVLCLTIDMGLSDARLYLTYVNPYFRIFGEGLLGVLLCECMPQIQSRIKGWNKDVLEVISLFVFLGCFVINNFISSSIWNAWIWFIPVSFILIAFNDDSGIISQKWRKRNWQFLGNISFELYMTHAFVYEGIPFLAGIINNSLKDWIIYHAGTRFIITFIACIVFGWIIHIIFNFKKEKTGGRGI